MRERERKREREGGRGERERARARALWLLLTMMLGCVRLEWQGMRGERLCQREAASRCGSFLFGKRLVGEHQARHQASEYTSLLVSESRPTDNHVARADDNGRKAPESNKDLRVPAERHQLIMSVIWRNYPTHTRIPQTTPPPRRREDTHTLRTLARQSRLKGATDYTRYGAGRASSKAFLTHHVANISTAIQVADANSVLAAASHRSLRQSLGLD